MTVLERVETQTDDVAVETSLTIALKVLKANKPDERSEKARKYAVTITEMEKVCAYFNTYVINDLDRSV